MIRNSPEIVLRSSHYVSLWHNVLKTFDLEVEERYCSSHYTVIYDLNEENNNTLAIDREVYLKSCIGPCFEI